MIIAPRRSLNALLTVPFLTFLLALIIAFLPLPSLRGQERKAGDPWQPSETMQPAALAKILTDKYASLPTIVYVGFHSLYLGGHVPDAVFHGTASTESGLTDLKSWAGTLSRDSDIVIYCGCCPFEKCPNIRPAYTALSSMGFKKIRVLVLPTSFATDWAEKGYPMQKAK